MSKFTEQEKAARKHQRKADAVNAKAKEEAGIFAFAVEEVTATDAYWHWRRQVAIHGGAGRGDCLTDFDGRKLLTQIQEAVIRNHARRLIPAGWFKRLDEYRFRVLPWEFGWGFWRDVLTCRKRTVFGYRRIPDEERKPGQPVTVESDYWPPDGTLAPMTDAEYNAMFPVVLNEPSPQPGDDGGLDAMLVRLFRCEA